jgi:hypothetical protein
MPKFACRQCRKEVQLDEDGVANHLDDTPACIPIVGDKPMADWDRHEVVEDESTLASDEEVVEDEVVAPKKLKVAK